MEWEKMQKAKSLDEGLQAKADLITEIETIVEGAKARQIKNFHYQQKAMHKGRKHTAKQAG